MKGKNIITSGSVQSPAAKALTKHLKRQRQEKGLTMREIGDLMNGPHSFVGKVENNERRLDVVEYAKYCLLLGIDAIAGFAIVMEQAKAELEAEQAQRS
jgi:transcriptional regulator with XRE-family HTH domain